MNFLFGVLKKTYKPLTLILASAVLLLQGLESCKKDGGKTKIRADFFYTGVDTVPGPPQADTPRYTQFGTYIGSITPSVFTAKFNTIRFQDVWKNQEAVLMELIDNNASIDDAQRYAKFSEGVEVLLQPKIYWANNTGQKVTDKKVRFEYFYWDLKWFFQEIELPAAYKDVTLQQFYTEFNYTLDKGDTAQKGLLVRSDHYPFIDPLFGTAPGELPSLYVFGNTDSTFVYNLELQPKGNNKDNPMGGGSIQPIIRSNKYEPLDFIYSEGEEMNIRAVVTFDYENLIQIYAGADNKPYTHDDVFVYAPRFWERLSVRVVQTK